MKKMKRSLLGYETSEVQQIIADLERTIQTMTIDNRYFGLISLIPSFYFEYVE